jgi:hypothetical protein
MQSVTGTRTPTQRDDTARLALRRFAPERFDPADLPGLIRATARQRALWLADLDAGIDLDDDERRALLGGVALAEQHLAEYAALADRHRRAMTQPGYGPVEPGESLGPRFDAARWVDQVDLYETLTGQAAIMTGNGRYRLRCPFHDDDRPSLVIYPPGRGWHCFVCGVGGSPVDFVMRARHVNAVEALLLIEQIADTCPAAWERSS